MTTKKIFITATDTDAGKTYVSRLIIRKLVEQKLTVAAYKPISAGCDLVKGKLVNEDAKLLTNEANAGQNIEEVNPIAFEEPIAPHIAAKSVGRLISINEIGSHFNNIIDKDTDVVLTEGAGGWRLPLGENAFLSEFAVSTGQQVILVVNMKLGCLNHALLTYETILRDGLTCIGWVANCIETMPYLADNLAELKSLIKAPCLGILPNEKNIDVAINNLDLTSIIVG